MSNENDEQNRAEVAATSPTADDYVRATALAVGVDPDEAVAYRRATDRTQPAGEHHTGTLDLTGEGNAPGSPISYRIWDGANHYDDIDPSWSRDDAQAMARGLSRISRNRVRLVEITETEIPFT